MVEAIKVIVGRRSGGGTATGAVAVRQDRTLRASEHFNIRLDIINTLSNYTGNAPTPPTCVPTTIPSAVKRSIPARCVSLAVQSVPSFPRSRRHPLAEEYHECDGSC